MAGFAYPTAPFFSMAVIIPSNRECSYINVSWSTPSRCYVSVPVRVVVLLVHHLEPRRHDGRLHHGRTPVDRQHRRRDGVEVRAVLDLAEEACGLQKREGDSDVTRQSWAAALVQAAP